MGISNESMDLSGKVAGHLEGFFESGNGNFFIKTGGIPWEAEIVLFSEGMLYSMEPVILYYIDVRRFEFVEMGNYIKSDISLYNLLS